MLKSVLIAACLVAFSPPRLDSNPSDDLRVLGESIENVQISSASGTTGVQLHFGVLQVNGKSGSKKVFTVTTIYDTLSKLFWWEYSSVPSDRFETLSVDQLNRHFKDTKHAIISDSYIVVFDRSGKNLFHHSSGTRFPDFESAQKSIGNILVQQSETLAKAHATPFGVTDVSALGRELFEDPRYALSTQHIVDRFKIIAVKPRGQGWEVAVQGYKARAKLFLDEKFTVERIVF